MILLSRIITNLQLPARTTSRYVSLLDGWYQTATPARPTPTRAPAAVRDTTRRTILDQGDLTMRIRNILIKVAAVAVVASGLYYGLEVYPQKQFHAGLDETLAALPPGTAASSKGAHYSVLSRQAVIT